MQRSAGQWGENRSAKQHKGKNGKGSSTSRSQSQQKGKGAQSKGSKSKHNNKEKSWSKNNSHSASNSSRGRQCSASAAASSRDRSRSKRHNKKANHQNEFYGEEYDDSSQEDEWDFWGSGGAEGDWDDEEESYEEEECYEDDDDEDDHRPATGSRAVRASPDRSVNRSQGDKVVKDLLRRGGEMAIRGPRKGNDVDMELFTPGAAVVAGLVQGPRRERERRGSGGFGGFGSMFDDFFGF